MISKFNLILCIFLSVVTAQASLEETRKEIYESQSACDEAVFTDSNYLALSFPNNVVRVYSLLDKSLVLEVPSGYRVRDLKIQNDTLYILTGNRLMAWQMKEKKPLFGYVTHPNVRPNSHWVDKASGFILNKNQAVVSHGAYGISVIDLATGNYVKLLPMPTVSAAKDIDFVNSNTAVLAIDNNDEAQFRGMYLFDLNSLEITKQIKIDNAMPSAVRVLANNRLMMVYFNAVWKFDLNQALSQNSPQPNRRAWRFPGLFVVDMIGKVAFDQKNLYACFKTMDEKTGERDIVPLAIDLKSVKLD